MKFWKRQAHLWGGESDCYSEKSNFSEKLDFWPVNTMLEAGARHGVVEDT